MLSWAHIGLAGSFGALLVCGCGALAVSRKTPIYFLEMVKMLQMKWYIIVCILLYLTNCVLGIIVPDCIVHVALHVVIVVILRVLVSCLSL